LPVIKPKKRNPKGFGARIRDKIYNEEVYEKDRFVKASLVR
jgi:hypothetical protein